MNEYQKFQLECAEEIIAQQKDAEYQKLSQAWLIKAQQLKYSYHFEWLGRPIIQYPQDMIAMQELIWQIKPTLIIETGIAHGGSLIFYASMMALLDQCEGKLMSNSTRRVVGIDIDIRQHNREFIEKHPLSKYITMIQGSSIAKETFDAAENHTKPNDIVMVCLDSNHTHEHVLDELKLYSKLVSPLSYCVVFDTSVDIMPDNMFEDRPWKASNSPGSAVKKFIEENNQFQVDSTIDAKLGISISLNGYLKKSPQ